MKVAHFTAVREIEITEIPEPTLNRPDAVLLRIDRVGVCGSDVHYYLNGRIGDQVVHYPGHARPRMRRHGGRGRGGGRERRARRPRGRRSGDGLRHVRPVPGRAIEHLPQSAVHGLSGRGPGRGGRVSRRAGRELLSHPDSDDPRRGGPGRAAFDRPARGATGRGLPGRADRHLRRRPDRAERAACAPRPSPPARST